jgi:hypothetical protein
MLRRIGALLLVATVAMGGLSVPAARAADNQPPVAVDDPPIPGCQPAGVFGGAYPIPEDFSFPADDDWFSWFDDCFPTANDTDPEGDPLMVELVGQPAHGEATSFQLGSNEILRYRADPDWSTLPGDVEGGDWFSDSIPYRVSDGHAWSDTASFRIWLAPINDAPTFTPGAELVEGEVNGDVVSLPWATSIDPGPYESAQTVTFEVETDDNNAPTAFLVPPAIDGDGVLTFTPGNEPTLATVTVTAKDDGGLEDWDMGAFTSEPPADTSEPVTFQIVIWGPGAVDDEVTVPEDTGWLVDVLENDNDGGNPITIVDVTDGAKGSTEVLGDVVVYSPAQDATGADSFTYTIEDTEGRQSDATVSVTITPANDDPVAVDDAIEVELNAGIAPVDVLANDTDVDGDELSVESATQSDHGSVVLNGGVVRYWPDTGYTGTDSFNYTIEDGYGGSDTATVTVTVTSAANEGPVATDDVLDTDEDTAGTVDVLANDDDPDGVELTITGTTDGTKGTTDVVAGKVRYTPEPDANGSDSFTYTIEDEDGATDTATVQVTIDAVNDDPVAGDDTLTIGEGADATAVNVLGNDDDVDGDTPAVQAAGPAGHGTVTLATGVVKYEPDAGFAGADSFDYTISDGHGGSDPATVAVTVTADQVAPVVTTGPVEINGKRLGTDVGLRFRWTASDALPGVAAQALQQRRPNGSWRTIGQPAPGVTSVVVDATPRDAEALRVRATDGRGNSSSWTPWPEVEAVIRQESWSGVDWSGTWKRGESKGDSGGATRWTSASGRRATIEVKARAIAWVGHRQPDGGRAEVWVDGVKVATIDTDAGALQRRAILFRVAWTDRAIHTVQVRTLGGGRVDVDAFVIVR